MNTPAILTLNDNGTLRYVLLRELAPEQATLLGPNGAVRVPVAQLDPLWSGEYLLLWRRETDETTIGQRLAARLGAEAVGSLEDNTWDEALRKSVQRVQTQIGARPDGIAGPRTLLGLASQPGPTLKARKSP